MYKLMAVTLPVLVLLGACGQMGNPPNEVAIIDLNEVAQATGQDEVIRNRVEGVSAQLTDELRGLLSNMESQLQAEREKLGTNPAAADVQRIQALTAQAQQQIGQAQAEANRQVTALESELAQAFRDKLLPLARKEATSRGATIVLADDGYLVWADDAIDLTAAVIKAWDNLPDEQKVITGPAEDADGADPQAEEGDSNASAPATGADSDSSAAPESDADAADAAAP